MNRQEYDQLRKQIEDKCSQDLEALERVYELSQGLKLKPAREPDKETEKETIRREFKSLLKRRKPSIPIQELVQEILPDLPEQFSSVDGRRLILLKHPEQRGNIDIQTISGVFKRMVDRGEIELVHQGTSRWKPSIFRKKSRENREVESHLVPSTASELYPEFVLESLVAND